VLSAEEASRTISPHTLLQARRLRDALPGDLAVLIEINGEWVQVDKTLQAIAGDEVGRMPPCVRFSTGPQEAIEIRRSASRYGADRSTLPILTLLADAHEQLNLTMEQLDTLADQTSHWLEESCFLRRLACMLDLTNGQDTESILDQIGDDLCTLCSAQSLVALGSSPRDDTQPPRTFGHPLEPATIEAILRWLPASPSTIIRNNRQELAKEIAPDTESILAVPLAYGDQCFGWFVAVNSRSPDGFGTVEATLLETTASVLGVHANNLHLLREQEQFLIDMVQALVSAIDAKDPYTCGHSARVAWVARSIAEHMGLDEATCHNVFLAGLLHDVGKIGVEDSVLRKPGRLTDEEFEEIKKHPRVGHRILRHLKRLAFALPGVLYHHERLDGKGYPDGLAGTSIPLIARIIAVADSFDAMASDRPYRKGMPIEKVLAILRSGAGSQWDPEVVDVFLKNFDSLYAVWQRHNTPQISYEDLTSPTRIPATEVRKPPQPQTEGPPQPANTPLG